MINIKLEKGPANIKKTFLRMSAMIPMRVRTCWRDSPSRGTPSANLSTLSAIGSHRCLMNNETYALKTRSGLPRRSRTSLRTQSHNTVSGTMQKYQIWHGNTHGKGACYQGVSHTPLKTVGSQCSPIFWVPFYLCVHRVSQNYQPKIQTTLQQI